MLEERTGVHPEGPAETTRCRGQRNIDSHDELRPLEAVLLHAKLCLRFYEGGRAVAGEVEEDEGAREAPVHSEHTERHARVCGAADHGCDVAEEHAKHEEEARL